MDTIPPLVPEEDDGGEKQPMAAQVIFFPRAINTLAWLILGISRHARLAAREKLSAMKNVLDVQCVNGSMSHATIASRNPRSK
jgi:hypothetical protein